MVRWDPGVGFFRAGFQGRMTGGAPGVGFSPDRRLWLG